MIYNSWCFIYLRLRLINIFFLYFCGNIMAERPRKLSSVEESRHTALGKCQAHVERYQSSAISSFRSHHWRPTKSTPTQQLLHCPANRPRSDVPASAREFKWPFRCSYIFPCSGSGADSAEEQSFSQLGFYGRGLGRTFGHESSCDSTGK